MDIAQAHITPPHRGKGFVFFVRQPTCRVEASETKEVRISRAGTRVRYVDFQKDELVSISGSCCGTDIVGSEICKASPRTKVKAEDKAETGGYHR